jgi:hypothetical protein
LSTQIEHQEHYLPPAGFHGRLAGFLVECIECPLSLQCLCRSPDRVSQCPECGRVALQNRIPGLDLYVPFLTTVAPFRCPCAFDRLHMCCEMEEDR